MVDTPTARFGARKQSLGSNVNTWGDTKLNDVFDLFDRGAKGFEVIALTGDLTLTWTSYSAANQGQVQTLKLTGSLAAPATLTVPSREWAWDVINAAGASVTVKTSAGTGVEIPAGYQAALYCDGVDVRNAAPTRLGGNLYAAGQIRNVTAGTANADAVNKQQMDNAIALATTATSPGTLRVTASDTTAKFLNGALVVSGSLTKTVVNPGANETLEIAYTDVPFIVDGGVKTANFTVLPGYKYVADCRAGVAIAAALDVSWTSAGALAQIVKIGTGALTLAQGSGPTKINGLASDSIVQPAGLIDIRYVDAAYGVATCLAPATPAPENASTTMLDSFIYASWST